MRIWFYSNYYRIIIQSIILYELLMYSVEYIETYKVFFLQERREKNSVVWFYILSTLSYRDHAKAIFTNNKIRHASNLKLFQTSRSTRRCPGKFNFNIYMKNTHWTREHLEKLDQWGVPLGNLFVESLAK